MSARSNVVNIETHDWTPSQVARWLQGETDNGDVTRVYVVIEYDNDIITHSWSKATCDQLWYLVSWSWFKLQRRYFDGERVAT